MVGSGRRATLQSAVSPQHNHLRPTSAKVTNGRTCRPGKWQSAEARAILQETFRCNPVCRRRDPQFESAVRFRTVGSEARTSRGRSRLGVPRGRQAGRYLLRHKSVARTGSVSSCRKGHLPRDRRARQVQMTGRCRRPMSLCPSQGARQSIADDLVAFALWSGPQHHRTRGRPPSPRR